VELQVSNDGGNIWAKATMSDVRNGIAQVVLPIPEGTNPDTHSYTVYHFADGWNNPGEKLNPTLHRASQTLSVTVDSFSPFVVVATPKSSVNDNSSSNDDGYDFWMNVKDKIEDANSGDTIKVKAYGYDKMPWSVMQALHKSKVSMSIEWSYGKDIYIAAGNAVNPSTDVGRVYYPLSYLEKLFAGKQADTSDTQNDTINPETGGVIEVVPNSPSLVKPVDKLAVKTPSDTGIATNSNEMLLSATPNAAHQSSKTIILILLTILTFLGGGYWYFKKRNAFAK